MHRHLLVAAHYRAAEAVSLCPTAEFGGQVHDFKNCARMVYVYHSCSHRACPKCGGREHQEWAAAQEAKLIRADYFMNTFTVSQELRSFAYREQGWFLCSDVQSDVIEPDGVRASWKHLGGTPGFSVVLHTWTREMGYHPHLHVIMPGLALSADGLRVHRAKEKRYLFPVKALAAGFRNRVRRLIEARDAEEGT